jgi:hypothetical protein
MTKRLVAFEVVLSSIVLVKREKSLVQKRASNVFQLIYTSEYLEPHRCYLHLIVVVGFECSRDPESYAGGSVPTVRATQVGQVKR